MTDSKKTLISFQNVNLNFGDGRPLFHDLNLTIKEGSFYFLTGPSGAGKSTLLKMIYLDQIPSYGNIQVFGHRSRHLTANQAAMLRRQMGVVFQDFRLIPHLSILENVLLPLEIKGMHNRKRHDEAKEFLDWVGLSEHLDVPVPLLSGGQQQRAAIVRAVISKPQLLLADEPTGNVDDNVAMRLLYLFEELYKTGTTVLIATHNHFLAESFPYPELVLENGKIYEKPLENTSSLSQETFL